jgi:hypothetical protein
VRVRAWVTLLGVMALAGGVAVLVVAVAAP